MSTLAGLVQRVGERRLDLVAGLADGILTALTLTAGRLLGLPAYARGVRRLTKGASLPHLLKNGDGVPLKRRPRG
jgi:hypothetical protein